MPILFFISVIPTIVTSGNWISYADKNGKTAFLRYQKLGDTDVPSLKGLRKALDSRNEREAKLPLTGLNFTDYFLNSEELQKELFEVFQSDFPEILKEALKSSGNMHNPKVIPLRSKFSEVLLKTKTVREIEAALNSIGYSIESVSSEKFSIKKGETRPTFFSFVWLNVKPQ